MAASSPNSTDSPQKTGAHDLGASFRQSRREMWVILAAWTAFLLWSGITCAALTPEPGDPVPTLLGVPRWAALGVMLPWICAIGFIFWFAGCFMQDTDLGTGDGDG